MQKRVIIFSAPSGSGKNTIINAVKKNFLNLEFSISATNRDPREGEQEGREYYFISTDEFKDKVAKGEFVEWEEVYAGRFYGTLKSEYQRIWDKGHVVIKDVDVKGAVNIKKYFNDEALTIFITPPSIEELRRRLANRGTESEEEIDKRIARAQEEMSYKGKFDKVVVNDNLDVAVNETKKIISSVF